MAYALMGGNTIDYNPDVISGTVGIVITLN